MSITNSTAAHLSDEDVEAFGRELDAIRDRVLADRGERDAAYIRTVIAWQRRLDVGGRIVLLASLFPPAWLAGTAAVSVAKILENMEIGHNVMHGQWDWMRDPEIHSTSWEWDNVSPAASWKHSHNVLHHSWTNVVGKDPDVGYRILRMDDDQPWSPYHLTQPVVNLLLSLFFEWGVAFHDLDVEAVKAGTKSKEEFRTDLRLILGKIRRQVLKDYVVHPLLSGPSFVPTLLSNVTSNFARNLWAHAVIFCGHFPNGAETFREEEIEGETRAQWYLRQLLGSANIKGGDAMHLMTGNLSFQIEHHLFPDLPSNRYKEIAPQVQALCARYGLPYTTGSLPRQYASTVAKIFRMALPPARTRREQNGRPLAPVAPLPAPPIGSTEAA